MVIAELEQSKVKYKHIVGLGNYLTEKFLKV
jgi:hypothetical protein